MHHVKRESAIQTPEGPTVSVDAVITTSDYFVDIVGLLDIFSEDANEPSETRDVGSCFTISPAHPVYMCLGTSAICRDIEAL